MDARRRWQWPPLGVPSRQRNCAEVKLAEHTLDAIQVAQPRGRSKQRPAKLVADRGYDSRTFRQALRRRGMQMCIPLKRRPTNWKARRGRPVVARKADYRLRYTVERSFAWLGNFRRLLIRWEHLVETYRSFFAVAVMMLCLRRLIPAQAGPTGTSDESVISGPHSEPFEALSSRNPRGAPAPHN